MTLKNTVHWTRLGVGHMERVCPCLSEVGVKVHYFLRKAVDSFDKECKAPFQNSQIEASRFLVCFLPSPGIGFQSYKRLQIGKRGI